MKPSRVWTAPTSWRGWSIAAILVAVAGCCGQTTAPREVFDKSPSPANEKAVAEVLGKLGGEEGNDPGKLAERLRTKLATAEAPVSPMLQAFLAGMKCRPQGCYATLPASSKQDVALIEDLVTNPNTALRRWGGWRYLSGMYEARTGTGVQRVQTIVLLDEQPSRKAATTGETKTPTQGAAQ